MLVLGASYSENSFQIWITETTLITKERITRLPLNQFKNEKKNSYSKVSPGGGEQSSFLKVCQGKSVPKRR